MNDEQLEFLHKKFGKNISIGMQYTYIISELIKEIHELRNFRSDNNIVKKISNIKLTEPIT